MKRDEVLQGVIAMLSRYEGRGSNYTALTESTALEDRPAAS
jgi:hypothetical protein